ncbi:MAG: ketoacyl-ACP synthase III [Bacteriovoracaceae bacterium]|nr:ketoacyl-ACP synthase III [Bacteriovoracaceae bacterium]
MNSIVSKISGTGHYVPSHVVTNEELCKRVDTTDEWIRERTGIKERRIGDPKQDFPSYMATQAAKMALEEAKLSPNEIDFILFSVTIPDFLFPNTASLIQENLGMTHQCPSLDINAACSGYVYGMVVADALIKTGAYKNILLIGSELTSRFNNWEDRSSCILFGDGAGATIISRTEGNPKEVGILKHILGSDPTKKDALILRAGGSRIPITKEILDNKENFVTMDGQSVFKAAVKTLASQCEFVLRESNTTHDQVDWFIPHQANLRIIEAVGDRFKFPKEKVIINVDQYANTSSASIPIAISEAVKDKRIKRGQLLLLATFGAGLTSGALAIRY